MTPPLEQDPSLPERAVLLLQNAGAKLAEPEFGQLVTLRATLPAGAEAPLLPAFAELTRGAAAPRVSPPFYAPF